MAVILRTSASIGGTLMSSPGISQVWWAPQTAGGSTADATDCLARFRAMWDAVKALMSPGITLTFDNVCLAIEATTGVLQGTFTGTLPLSVTGTGVTDALPRQTQGLLRVSTNTVINGRRVRGRLFVPGPVETHNDSSGLPNSTYTSTLTTAAAGLLVAGATTSMPVVWHRPLLPGQGAAPLWSGVAASPNWSVLRSRRA